jgi:hypothetical protein
LADYKIVLKSAPATAGTTPTQVRSRMKKK